MNRRWFMPLAAALIAGLAAFVVARRMACPCRDDPLRALTHSSFLARELGLTDSQRNEIDALHAALAVEIKNCCERHCAARMRLASELAGDDSGGARTDEILGEMCRAYSDSERAALAHIRRVRELLDPDQRARFDRLFGKTACRTCPKSRAAAGRPGHTR